MPSKGLLIFLQFTSQCIFTQGISCDCVLIPIRPIWRVQKGQQEPRNWTEGTQRSSCLYMVSAGSFPGPQVTPISGRISVICPKASSSIPVESLAILESLELGWVFTVSWTYLKGRRSSSEINLCNTNYNFKIHLPPMFKIMEPSSLWHFLEQLQEWGLPRHLGCDTIYSSAQWPPHPHPPN